MKKITLICVLAFFALVAQAQNSFPPAYYIDSQRVELGKVYFSVDSIVNLNVVNGMDSVLKTNGRIYFTLKHHYNSFLTLSDIVSGQQPDFLDKKVIYIINDKVIKDTTGIRIDPSFVLEVHAVSMADLPYLSDGRTNMGVVVIETKRKEPVPPKDAKGTINLRGAVVKN